MTTTGGPNTPKKTDAQRQEEARAYTKLVDDHLANAIEDAVNNVPAAMGAMDWSNERQAHAKDYLMKKLEEVMKYGDKAAREVIIAKLETSKKLWNTGSANAKILRQASEETQRKSTANLKAKGGDLTDFSPRKTAEAEKKKAAEEKAAREKEAAAKQQEKDETAKKEQAALKKEQEGGNVTLHATPVVKERHFSPLNKEKATKKTNAAQMDDLLGGNDQHEEALFGKDNVKKEPASPAQKVIARTAEEEVAKKRAKADELKRKEAEAARKAEAAKKAEEDAVKAKKADQEAFLKNVDKESAKKGMQKTPIEGKDHSLYGKAASVAKDHPFYSEIELLSKQIANLEAKPTEGKKHLGFQYESNNVGRKEALDRLRNVLIHTRIDADKPQKSFEILKSRVEGAIGANKEFRAGPGITDSVTSTLNKIKDKIDKLDKPKSKSVLDKMKDKFNKPRPTK